MVDADEARELFDLLQKFVGDDSELGELAKPQIYRYAISSRCNATGKNFCLTGTFEFGNRKACQTAVTDAGEMV